MSDHKVLHKDEDSDNKPIQENKPSSEQRPQGSESDIAKRDHDIEENAKDDGNDTNSVGIKK